MKALSRDCISSLSFPKLICDGFDRFPISTVLNPGRPDIFQSLEIGIVGGRGCWPTPKGSSVGAARNLTWKVSPLSITCTI